MPDWIAGPISASGNTTSTAPVRIACNGMPKMTEQLEVYQGAGFILSGLYPVGVYRPTLGVIEFDAVMVRPDAVRAMTVPTA